MFSVDAYIYLTIAMIGLAYPVLLQVIARLDEKYESENIVALFETEREWPAFRYTLVAALISVFIWSLKLEPRIKIEGLNYIIDNSGIGLVSVCTILLVMSFFFFVRRVRKYYTLYSIIPYLVNKHEESESKTRYFLPLSDLLLLTIKKQQTNPSRTLANFFYVSFRKVRDEFRDRPVVYPDLYYETLYKAIEELAILKEKRNYLLEEQTSGATWLLGDIQGQEISEVTYSWLWNNILVAVRYKQDDLVVNHWETCHQHYVYNIPYITEAYDGENFQVSNQEVVDKRKVERHRFIEFHYALGGLLLYKSRYSCIKRLFSYTQSQPPKYELLPESMQTIFEFYFDIRDLYERKYSWISHRYPFPELSGLNADHVIKKWVMSYMALLFLRQYTVIPFLITIQPLNPPSIPQTQGEIKHWIDGLSFFKDLVDEHLKNTELLKILNFDFISRSWCTENHKPYPTDFIITFKKQLENAYLSNALNLPISSDKVSMFEDATKTIIESEITLLQQINNSNIIPDDNSDKWYSTGRTMLQSKDVLSKNPEVSHSNFDSFMASTISKNLNDGLGTTFFYKRTKSFLLKAEEIFKAIDQLGIDNKYVIVTFGLNLEYLIEHFKISELSREKYKGCLIYSFNGSQIVNNSLFIIRKSDLPNISTRPIAEETITKYALKKISEKIDLYTSVIDLNTATAEVFNENKQADLSEEELKKSALMSIIISTEFKWKKDLEVIQIVQYSEFLQKGILNKLDEVKPVNKEK